MFRSLILLLSLMIGSSAFAQTATPAGEASNNAVDGLAVKPKPSDSGSAYDYNVLLETKEERFNVGIFGQFSSFTRAGKSFTGNPFEVLAGYALTPKVGFNFNVMQALDLANGAEVLYTGLRTSAAYTFIGENFSKRSTVLVNGAPSVTITPFQEPTLQADFGFDQIFFNGTSRVAPATGMSAGVQYAKTISTYRVAAMLRYGSLKVNNDAVDLITAGLGLLYRF